jgi:signal transduction histidine kinase
MRLSSLQFRMLLAFNIPVLLAGTGAGWAALYVTSRAIEQQLVEQPAANAAALISQMHLPLTDTLMRQLRQILGGDVCAVSASDRILVAASLGHDVRGKMQEQLSAEPGKMLTLAGRSYRVGRANLTANVTASRVDSAEHAVQLWLLVPAADLAAAKRPAYSRIAGITLLAMSAATLLSLWLSFSLARPIAQLSAYMQRVPDILKADGAGTNRPAPISADRAVPHHSLRKAPGEVRTLVTGFEQLVTSLREARRGMVQAERLAAVGRMAASVAHELRNPLSGIRMNAKVLSDELARRNLADPSLEMINNEIARLDLYLEELLCLATGEDPHLPAPPENNSEAGSITDLNAMIDSTLRFLQVRFRHAGIAVELRGDRSPLQVRAPHNRIRQVLVNLLLNAAEAMPHGGTITVESWRDEAGRKGGVSVSDTGTGISTDNPDDLFEAFVTSKQSGVGLGLYVSRSIISALGGTISCMPGEKGARFWFELPLWSDKA